MKLQLEKGFKESLSNLQEMHSRQSDLIDYFNLSRILWP